MYSSLPVSCPLDFSSPRILFHNQIIPPTRKNPYLKLFVLLDILADIFQEICNFILLFFCNYKTGPSNQIHTMFSYELLRCFVNLMTVIWSP